MDPEDFKKVVPLTWKYHFHVLVTPPLLYSWLCTVFEDYGQSGCGSKLLSLLFFDFYKIQKYQIYQVCCHVKELSTATWYYDVTILLVYITLESPVPQMLWSSNLHRRYFLTRGADWWRHHFSHENHYRPKIIFADITKFEKWCHQST